MTITKKNIFFSLVIYKQKIHEIEKLLFSIQALEKHIQNEFNIFFLISDNSPRKYIENPLLKHEAILRKTSYTFHNFNLGYGRGHNFNLLKGETKFIKKNPKDIFLIVNPDISFDAKNFSQILQWYEKTNNISCTSPLIFNDKNKIQYSAKKDPTFLSLFLGRIYFLQKLKFFKNYNDWHTNKIFDYKKDTIKSSYLSGCFLITKRKFFEKVKGFSEEYFLHLEDADLVRKLAKKGLTIQNPISNVTHQWARGSHKSLSQMLCLIKSYLIYSWKWGINIW